MGHDREDGSDGGGVRFGSGGRDLTGLTSLDRSCVSHAVRSIGKQSTKNQLNVTRAEIIHNETQVDRQNAP